MTDKKYTTIKKKYNQKSIRKRIETFFLDNIGKIATREQIIEVATDPNTGKVPENWHQRLSELRTDHGYTILTKRNRGHLKISEYLMPNANKRKTAGKRNKPSLTTWKKVLEIYKFRCAWVDGKDKCNLKNGDIDHVGGGTVKLTPDHRKPHSLNPDIDPNDPLKWQPLCGRHQVVKKNFGMTKQAR